MRKLVVALLTTLAIAGTAVLSADAADSVAQYSFVVANAPKDILSADGRMRVRLLRWSTDDERRQVMNAVAEPATLLSAIPYVDVVGYLQWPGGLEHSIRYARQTPRSDGGSDIVMVVERPLWIWWDATQKWAADQQFSVVHLRLNKGGTGEGRIATGDGFRRDPDTGIAIADVTKPALLTDVRRDAVK